MAKLYIKNTDGTFAPHSPIAVTNLDIVQGKGNSLTSAMSQKAVTDEFGTIQDAIASIVNAGYVFAGVATPSTDPGTPNAKVFYIANGKGTYTNFGGLEVTEDEVVVLKYDTAWHKVATGIASQEKITELVNKIDIFKNAGYLYAGVATPTTNPGTPDAKVFYIASTADTYSDFGGIVVDKYVSLLSYNGQWTKAETTIPIRINDFQNALKVTGTGTGEFNSIATANVFIAKNTRVKITYNCSELGTIGWRIYANQTGGSAFAGGKIASGVIYTDPKDYDITKLIFYADGNSNCEFYVSYEYVTNDEMTEFVNSLITELMTQLNNLTEYVNERFSDLTKYVGEPKIITQSGTKQFSGSLALIYTYTPENNQNDFTINVTNISDSQVTRCVVYRDATTSGQIEMPRTSPNSFGCTIQLDTYSGPIRIYLVGGTGGTCDYKVVEEYPILPTSLNSRVTELEQSAPTGGTLVSPYKDMVGICMGDSHAVRRLQWIPRIFEKIGATYDADTATTVVGAANETGAGYEAYADSLLAQAVRAVEQYQNGKQIDLIIMDNVHYVASGNINDAFPLKIKNIINLGQQSIAYINADTWFNNNIQTILNGRTPTLGTVVYAKLENTKYRLTFSGTPQVGEMIVTVDGHAFNAIVESGDTLAQVVQKLGIWSFGDYTDWTNSIDGNSIDLTYKGTATQIPVPTISLNAGTTGLTMSQTTQSTYTDYRRYLQSYNINDWLDSSKWVRISNWFGYSALKGVYETLLDGIPNVTIICVALPCYGITTGQFSTGLGGDMKAFYDSAFYSSNRARATTFMEAGKYYNVKVVDVEKLCGLSLSNWFTFNPSGDVHPNQAGYNRWADTIIKEMI